MKRDIEVCTLEDSAAKAAEIMSQRNCGFVPLVRGWNDWYLEGVITDRDLGLFLGKTDRRASEVRLAEFGSRDIRTVYEDDDIHMVEALMEEAHIHRVPVTDRNGKISGIIALKDLADEAFREKRAKHPEVTEKEIAEIVESISTAR
jgi:CBS domain-containing protein